MRPHSSPIHGWVNAADIRFAAGESQIFEIVNICRIERCVKRLYGNSGEGLKMGLALFLRAVDISVPRLEIFLEPCSSLLVISLLFHSVAPPYSFRLFLL